MSTTTLTAIITIMKELKKVLLLNKKVSETPLECVKRFKETNPEYKDLKLGYAGRLDPMAKGLLLVLVGYENKKKIEYEGLTKEYTFEVIFGTATDSYDILGLPEKSLLTNLGEDFDDKLIEVFESYKGEIVQKLPIYSAGRVNGKPLFKLAKDGLIKEEGSPTRNVTIYNIELLGKRECPISDLLTDIERRILGVNGNFRQKEIIEAWKSVIKTKSREQNSKILVYKIKVKCSHGTYIRSLTHEIGNKLKTKATVFEIERTRIGDFSLIPTGV